jgi:uncharacterized protein (UPF0276 family)
MNVQGRGLGLRREFALELSAQPKRADIDFLEVVPDNWMGMGGESVDTLERLAAKYPFVAHSLSLSIGDGLPLDRDYLGGVRAFLERFDIAVYGDHFCISRDSHGYLYDLLPVPRNAASATMMVDKIKAVQDFLSRRLVLENISYYYEEENQIPEADFIASILERSGCGLLLDVNNVYVNGRNHGTDPFTFLNTLPQDAVAYYHVAGHLDEPDRDHILDTHGTPVSEEVMELGAYAVTRFGEQPIVLERDNHLPVLDELCKELGDVHFAMTGRADEVTA